MTMNNMDDFSNTPRVFSTVPRSRFVDAAIEGGIEMVASPEYSSEYIAEMIDIATGYERYFSNNTEYDADDVTMTMMNEMIMAVCDEIVKIVKGNPDNLERIALAATQAFEENKPA